DGGGQVGRKGKAGSLRKTGCSAEGRARRQHGDSHGRPVRRDRVDLGKRRFVFSTKFVFTDPIRSLPDVLTDCRASRARREQSSIPDVLKRIPAVKRIPPGQGSPEMTIARESRRKAECAPQKHPGHRAL